jgi:Fe-S cluster biosynthesis and repair protein YggX
MRVFFCLKNPKTRKFLAQDLAQFLAQESLDNKKRFQ